MDDRSRLLRDKFLKLLREAAELKVTLDRADGTIRGVPHYSVIEETAHELGREVSRMVQAMHLSEVVAEYPPNARCPECGTQCKLRPKERTVLSGDGKVELQELVGRCPCCRRDFFPAARDAGL
jgi:uncharacterized protein with PIN domain